ncbi:uncharacterized protein UTRI_06235 [Ustilago trichophora]|uniref:Uncharacterized protein n=1 Tax=Ustilago trichophora TaxID=86804 RepID=A0A5C3EI47_9BASI|nr:uncharacterized protein UTRI_06235 [Ustilago trichophora]
MQSPGTFLSGVVSLAIGISIVILTSTQVQAVPGNTLFGKSSAPKQPSPSLPSTLLVPGFADKDLERNILTNDVTQLTNRLKDVGYAHAWGTPQRPDLTTMVSLQAAIRNQMANTPPDKRQYITLPITSENSHPGGPDRMYAMLLRSPSPFQPLGLKNVAGRNKMQTFAIFGVLQLPKSQTDPRLQTHLGLYGFGEVRNVENLHKELDRVVDQRRIVHNLYDVLSVRNPLMEQIVSGMHGISATTSLHIPVD